MKAFRLVASVFVVTIILASTAWAQPGNRMSLEKRMEAETNETIEALALTGDKAEAVRALLAARAEERTALMRSLIGGDAGMRRDAFLAKRAEQDAALAKKLVPILTPDELAKWKEFEAERGSRRRGPRPQRGGN